VTDDEIRRVGQQFIDGRRQLLKNNPFGLDPATVELGNRRWDFIDPLRMGLYVLTMGGPKSDQCWVVNFDHIQQVCSNPSAFAEKRRGSARLGHFDDAFREFYKPPHGAARASEFDEQFLVPAEPEIPDAVLEGVDVHNIPEMPDFDRSGALKTVFSGMRKADASAREERPGEGRPEASGARAQD